MLVLAPEVAAVDEALYFHDRLRAAGIRLAGFVANASTRRPASTEADAIAAALRRGPRRRRVAGRDAG